MTLEVLALASQLSVTIPGQNCLFLPGEAQEKGVVFCLSARIIPRL